jgi:hypothetical protein
VVAGGPTARHNTTARALAGWWWGWLGGAPGGVRAAGVVGPGGAPGDGDVRTGSPVAVRAAGWSFMRR